MTKTFLKEIDRLLKIKTTPKYNSLCVNEYAFDLQLLQISPLYRQSRIKYLKLGASFTPKVCSTMRSLSATDLFKNNIEYSPMYSEILWFKNNHHELTDPDQEALAIKRFNDISIFHEQNHRIIWKLLPPPLTKDPSQVRRYLNFAEALVVTLDVALGEEIGPSLSPVFERMNLIYRSAKAKNKYKQNKKTYRAFLKSLFLATYYNLEIIHHDDILKAVNYVLPKQNKINQLAVKRSLELSELFTRVTNIEWQKRYLNDSAKKLKLLHKGSQTGIFKISADPLDIDHEFTIVEKVLDFFEV